MTRAPTGTKDSSIAFIEQHLGAGSIRKVEPVQSLWGGQGSIFRVQTTIPDFSHMIVKHIQPNAVADHPRGWQGEAGFTRKLHSYAVEANWYQHYALSCHCRVPRVYQILERKLTSATKHVDVGCDLANTHVQEHVRMERWLLLEDLAVQYPRIEQPSSIRPALQWLAEFHAAYMGHEGQGLWPRGCYWHLQTRVDEFNAMTGGSLKNAAHWLDKQLGNAQFQTLIHGDAKLANAQHSVSMDAIAMVDFQYVGRGCGVRDLVVMLASALTDEECQRHEKELLDFYFRALTRSLKSSPHNAPLFADKTHLIEREWRRLYPLAWADYHRFLAGWMPGHSRINAYMLEKTKRALQQFAQSLRHGE